MSPVTPSASSTLPFSDPELFQEAAKAAESQYSAWIRSTLREVAVQAIKKSLTVNHDRNQLILSEVAWIQVEAMCKKVASRWSEKLEQIGHKAVAARIREIVEQEGPSLFAPDTSSSSSTATAASSEQSLTLPATDSASAPLLPNPATSITAYSRLRQLGRRNVLAASRQPVLSADKAARYLQQAGHQNLTDWPYDWKIIDEAVAQVPARLHNRTTVDADVTLIPKSVWERQQAQQQGESCVTQDATKWLLNRKRKSAGRERLKPRRRPIDESASERQRLERIKQDLPRPPSRGDGTAQLAMQDIRTNWSQSERQQLDSYLHDTVGDESDPAPSVILGALSDVGRFHHWKQKEVDQDGDNNNDNDNDNDSNYTEKKRRRLQHDAVKERLGDHQEETSDFLAGRRQRVSRVMRTCTTDHDKSSCFDFDLSDSWLEGSDPVTGDKMLYAFSSLEVMVLDQDDNDGEDQIN